MKSTLILISIIFTGLASAGTCNLTSITKARHALTFSVGKYEEEVDSLRACIDLAKNKLGRSVPGTISIIPDPNSRELPYNEVAEHRVIRVSYSYYDEMTGIQYKGSLR